MRTKEARDGEMTSVLICLGDLLHSEGLDKRVLRFPRLWLRKAPPVLRGGWWLRSTLRSPTAVSLLIRQPNRSPWERERGSAHMAGKPPPSTWVIRIGSRQPARACGCRMGALEARAAGLQLSDGWEFVSNSGLTDWRMTLVV